MYKKFINGHSKSLYGIYRYLVYDKATGKKRTVFSKTYNMLETLGDPIYDPNNEFAEPWYKVMDSDRKLYDTNETPNGRNALTFKHYILSPNPIDNITVEELEDFIDEWLERGFQTSEGAGKFAVAVEMHDDNGILHAHVIFNNVNYEQEWEQTNRITSYLTPKILRQTQDLIQILAKERGWHNFLEKDLKDAELIRQNLDVEQQEVEEISDDLIQAQQEQIEFFEKNYNVLPFAKYKRPLEIASNGRIISTRQGSYIDKKEAEILIKEGSSNKEDIRKCIDLAITLSSSVEEFSRVMRCLNIDFSINNKGDFVYTHPIDTNRRFTGYKLGSNYTRKAILRRINKNKPLSLDDQRNKKYYTGKIAGAGIIAVTSYDAELSIKDLIKLTEINNKYNIWKNEDYMKKLDSLPVEAINERNELKWAMKASEKVLQEKPPRSVSQKIEKEMAVAFLHELTDEELKNRVNDLWATLSYNKKVKRKHKKGSSKSNTSKSTKKKKAARTLKQSNSNRGIGKNR